MLSAGDYWAAVPAFVGVFIVAGWRVLISQIDPGRARLRASAIGALVAIALLGLEALTGHLLATESGFVPGRVALGVILIVLAPTVQDALTFRASSRDCT